MSRIFRRLPKMSFRENGQSIVLIAVGFIGLVAFVGLAIDGGLLFVSYGHLRRAADAAALGAADQYHGNYDYAHMQNSAIQYLRLNQIDLDNASAQVYTCWGNGAGVGVDTNLCAGAGQPNRKLVRVVAKSKVVFSFLEIIGINSAEIQAEATGEAATLDVVLVLDKSESMTWYTADGVKISAGPDKDPSICNPDNCHPFHEVKNAANTLIDTILDPSVPTAQQGDRVSIVYFSDGWRQGEGSLGTDVIRAGSISYPSIPNSGWFNDNAAAKSAINTLTAYDPKPDVPGLAGGCDSIADPTNFLGVCRYYEPQITDADYHKYKGMQCLQGFFYSDFSTCATTNIGGGLKMAGGMFGVKPNMDAVWVVILLTDGEANATCLDLPGNILDCSRPDEVAANHAAHHYPQISFCPEFWDMGSNPECQDDTTTAYVRHSSSDPLYDADDYARDAADFVGCHSTTPAAACNGLKGQGAFIYTIGLGRQVLKRDSQGRAYADQLLRYIANVGEDHDPATDGCVGHSVPSMPADSDPMTTSMSYHCGNYYFVATGSELGDIFHQIASNIYTRIQK